MAYLIKEETLAGIADAIREKTGKSDNLAVKDMAEEIKSIEIAPPTPPEPTPVEEPVEGLHNVVDALAAHDMLKRAKIRALTAHTSYRISWDLDYSNYHTPWDGMIDNVYIGDVYVHSYKYGATDGDGGHYITGEPGVTLMEFDGQPVILIIEE